MKGVVFNLLEAMVEHELGVSGWEDVLDRSGSAGVYTALGSYPDEEFLGLVEAVSELSKAPVPELVRAFGEQSFPRLVERYPQFVEPHDNCKSFLLTLNDVIHPEVRKLYPGADVPDFDFSEEDPHTLVIGYKSARKFCLFAEGLITAAATHYGQSVEIEQRQCMLEGKEHCELVCRF